MTRACAARVRASLEAEAQLTRRTPTRRPDDPHIERCQSLNVVTPAHEQTVRRPDGRTEGATEFFNVRTSPEVRRTGQIFIWCV